MRTLEQMKERLENFNKLAEEESNLPENIIKRQAKEIVELKKRVEELEGENANLEGRIYTLLEYDEG